MNLQFKSTREQFPAHGKDIFYLKEVEGRFKYYSAEPTFATVEWQWQDGEGSSILHDERITKRPKDFPYFFIIDENGYEIFSDYFVETWPEEHKKPKHFWWMYTDEFFNALECNKA